MNSVTIYYFLENLIDKIFNYTKNAKGSYQNWHKIQSFD